MDAPEQVPIASPRPRVPRRAGLLAALVLVQVALGAFIGFALIDQRDRARAEIAAATGPFLCSVWFRC
jgi:hypothetical protein